MQFVPHFKCKNRIIPQSHIKNGKFGGLYSVAVPPKRRVSMSEGSVMSLLMS